MKLVLSHISAIEFWQSHCNGTLSDYAHPTSVMHPVLELTDEDAIRRELANKVLHADSIHVLVSSKERRRKHAWLQCHVCSSPLQRGSIMRVRDGLYVCSPELTFIQAASFLPLTKLIEYGNELCGVYAPSYKGEARIQTRREPITNKQTLLRFCKRMHGMNGARAALRALQWVEDGSASPMETFLWMRLCLPPRLGGWGFEKALFNQEIHLGASSRASTGKSLLRCDLYFPNHRVAIEYDSDEYHTGSTRIANDSVRRGALESKGIKVITITNREFFTYEEFRGKVYQLARYTGKQIRKPNNEQLEARRALRNDVFKPGLMCYGQRDCSCSHLNSQDAH